MASQNFIDECKIGANSNRMCRFVADNLLITQSNYLQSLEINSSIFNDGSIIGSLTASKAELALLNLPANTYHLTQDEEYDIEKNYYIVFEDNYILIDEIDDETKAEYNYGDGNEIVGNVYEASPFELDNATFTPQFGIRYIDDTEEYITSSKFTVEEIKTQDPQKQTTVVAYSDGGVLNKEYQCSLDFEATYYQTSDETYQNGKEYYDYDSIEDKYILLEKNLDYEVGKTITKVLYEANKPTHTIYEFYADACYQLGLTPSDTSFTNSGIELSGNPFNNNETLRVVIQEVEKVSCSIAKIDWSMQAIELKWLSGSVDYVFTPEDYSSISGSLKKYGPVNCVILGNSQVDGENVTLEDSQSIEENGETQYIIDASYFLYTQNLRTQAIQAIYDKLNGLTYYDLELTTYYGKPFLEVGNMIQVETVDGIVYQTYVLDHTFTYNGAFKSVIKSPALTTGEQKYKNQLNSSSITGRVRNTELIVDKVNQTITGTVNRVDSTGARLSRLKQTVDDITAVFSKSGGTNIIKNSQFLFTDETWKFATNAANNSNHTPLGEGYDGTLSGVTVSSAKIALKNFKLTSALAGDTDTSLDNLTGLIAGRTYNLHFYYKADPNTTNTIKLYSASNTDIVDIPETVLPPTNTMEEIIIPFIPRTSSCRLEFNTTTSDTSDSGYLYIYDLMMTIGESKSWETAPTEVYSTAVQMSMIGLTVTSSGAKVITNMTTDGFYIKKLSDKTVVTDMTEDGIITNDASVKQLDIRYNANTQYVMKEISINNSVHHIEYFDTED